MKSVSGPICANMHRNFRCSKLQASRTPVTPLRRPVRLYVAGGGVTRVTSALRESGAFRRIVAVGHGLTNRTGEGLMNGILKLAIAHPVTAMTQTIATDSQRNNLRSQRHRPSPPAAL
jgi:hypothetical protein